tara:strand:+ start:186 stop:470 length:285 start_codon:yes stop_codon:yes gene_type:complete
MKQTNSWLTSDIKISTDSAGYMDAVHKWQGLLIETGYYESRSECRRDAVKVLKERKEEELDEWSIQERKLDREADRKPVQKLLHKFLKQRGSKK